MKTSVACGMGWHYLTERNARTNLASEPRSIPPAREAARSLLMTRFHAIHADVHHLHELYPSERSATSLTFDMCSATKGELWSMLTGRPEPPYERSDRSCANAIRSAKQEQQSVTCFILKGCQSPLSAVSPTLCRLDLLCNTEQQHAAFLDLPWLSEPMQTSMEPDAAGESGKSAHHPVTLRVCIRIESLIT